jgi:hypothetical protein
MKSTSREYVGCLISWASRLDTDAGLAPVTSLGVVSEEKSVSIGFCTFVCACVVGLRCVWTDRKEFDVFRGVRPHSSVARFDLPSSFHFEVSRAGPGSFVPDGVVGAQTDPLRDGTVLLLGLGQLLLGAERLVGLYGYILSAGLWWCIWSAGGTPYRHLDGLCHWA